MNINFENLEDVVRGLPLQPPPAIEAIIQKVIEIMGTSMTVGISVNPCMFICINIRVIRYVVRRLVQESKVFKDLIWVVIGQQDQCDLSKMEFQLQIAQRLGISHSKSNDHGDVDQILSNKIHACLKNRSFLLVHNGGWKLEDLLKMGIPNIRDASYLVLVPKKHESYTDCVPRNLDDVDRWGDLLKEACVDVAESCNCQGRISADVVFECFIYLALFCFDDSGLNINSIILCLFGEGFIGHPGMDLGAILRFGKTLLDELCARDLIRYVEGRIRSTILGYDLLTQLGQLYDILFRSWGSWKEFHVKPDKVHRIGFFGDRRRRCLMSTKYPRLLTLFISQVVFLEIPQHAFESMPCLRVLIINDSNIFSFPPSLACLGDTLKFLSLHNCRIHKSLYLYLPYFLRGLRKLEILDLSSTPMEQVTDNSFKGLQSLRLLDMSECSGIHSFPTSISCLINIEHLILRNCKSLKVLPSVRPLEKLQYLNLSGTEVTTIPEQFFHHSMVNLEAIDLSSNPCLRSLPQSIFDLINLKKLHLNHCRGLQNIIPATQQGFFPSLEELNLRACESLEDINHVSSTFWDMVPNLKSLDLSETLVVSVISEKNLPSLKNITLQSNKNLLSVDLCGTNIEKFLLTEAPCLQGLESLNLEEAKYINKVSWRSVQGSHAEFNLDLCRNSMLSEWQRDGYRSGVFISVENGDIFHHLQEHHSWMKGRFLIYVCPRARLNNTKTLSKPRVAHRYKDIHSLMKPIMPSYERCLEIEQVETFPKGFTVVLGQTQSLYVHDEEVITKLSDFGIDAMKELRQCWIKRSRAMTVIFDAGSMGGPIFRNLENLHISDVPKLIGVGINTGCPTYGFGKLKHLCLEYCPRIVIGFPSGICLESLEELKIRFCPRLKEIISGKVNIKSLERLRSLSLFDLPVLENIADNVQLASLRTAHIKGCPRLRRIPFHRNSSKLVVTGEDEWWQQLEWDNDIVKQHVHFNPWSRYGRKRAA